MEYVCGDLLDFIRKRGKLSESISKLIFKQIIEGLRYIHKKKIVHRDIKLDNILIDLTNTVKICDFGVSRKLSNGDVMYEHCGTPAYIAPEIFLNKGYEGYLCDIWSAGVTLYYMLSGLQPFRANSIKELEKNVIQGKFEEIEEVSKEANDLINEMLQVDPKKRINIDKILKHPWLKNVDLENRKNLNLFTESEKILLSKFDVDYLTSQKEELIENFTLKNLETKNNESNLEKVGDTKSIIFAPYNSYIEESSTNMKFEEDKIYEELEILNDVCKFGWKVQQANIKYELSNNNDFDNGVIKTQKEEDIKNQNEKIEKKYEEKILNERLSGINTPRVRSANDSFEESEKIIVKKEIIKQIEKDVGYDRKYIINCIRKNKINYATATYYLLSSDNHQ
jgi:serine/threonine protein kinase